MNTCSRTLKSEILIISESGSVFPPGERGAQGLYCNKGGKTAGRVRSPEEEGACTPLKRMEKSAESCGGGD